jgi:predicted DNA-binding transcriptional regulator AlpA
MSHGETASAGLDRAALERIILEPERRELTGIGRTAWWRLEKTGATPLRRIITPGRTGWLLSELVEWMRSRPVGAGTCNANARRAA